MAVDAGEQDFGLSRVFALTIKALLRRPITALVIGLATVTLPSELYYRFAPYPGPSFSIEYILYLLGSMAIMSVGVILIAWMTLQFVGVRAPVAEASRRLVSLFTTDFAVLLVTALGLLALVIPGIVWSLATAVAVPAAAAERLGLARAVSRSLDLTRDRRVMIFVINLAVLLPPLLAVSVIEYALENWELSSNYRAITQGARPVTELLLAIWGAALQAAIYVELTRVAPAIPKDVAKPAPQ